MSGGDPMTGAQASYLRTLCEQAGEPFDPDLTKAEAAKRIDAMKDRTGHRSAGGAAGSPCNDDAFSASRGSRGLHA